MLTGFRRSAIALVLIGMTACRVTDLPLWRPPAPGPEAYEVERIPGIVYCARPTDAHRQSLDLFVPKGKPQFPVVVLVHGGAWRHGDKRCCGLVSSVGEHLARQGIGAVLPNYRLAPANAHPAQIRDIAQAVKWTKDHIGEYGGNADQLFMAGHSAGGHLVTLLATDDTYLRELGCSSADLRGVVGISDVYSIPEGNADIVLGGNSPKAFRLDEMLPLRADSAPRLPLPEALSVPVGVDIFGPPFGYDPRARQEASPIRHVHPGLPPFLLISAEYDLPLLRDMAVEMHKALRKAGVQSDHFTIANRNHNSILFKAIESTDPTARRLVDFILEQSRTSTETSRQP